MKIQSVMLCLAFAIASGDAGVRAGSVTLTSVGGRQFANQTGIVLPSGVAIRIGTFDLPAETRDETLRHTSDFAQLQAWFRPLGESIAGAGAPSQANGAGSRLRTNGFPTAGQVFGTIANIAGSYMSPGSKLYLWVFDDSTPENASQWGIFTAAEWNAPPTLGALALSTGSTTLEALQGQTTSGQLQLAVPPLTFGNWRMKKFATGAPATTIQFDSDPDGDGLHNLAEYAWQLNPLGQDKPRAGMSNDPATGAPKFTFKVPLHLSDVQVTAECSPDLRIWTPAPSYVTGTDTDFETRACDAGSGGGKCFWRVRFNAITPP